MSEGVLSVKALYTTSDSKGGLVAQKDAILDATHIVSNCCFLHEAAPVPII